MVLVPAPAAIVSLPAPPAKVSSPSPLVMILLAPLPVIVLLTALLVTLTALPPSSVKITAGALSATLAKPVTPLATLSVTLFTFTDTVSVIYVPLCTHTMSLVTARFIANWMLAVVVLDAAHTLFGVT